MAKHYRMLIGGEWFDGAAGPHPIINPANGATVGDAPQASVEQAEAAAQAARDALPMWSATPPTERARLLQAVADRLRERQPELVPLIISETGATAQVGSRMQVAVAIERFERYARGAVRDLSIPLSPSPTPTTPLAPGGLIGAMVNRQPVGVVACISPYNFPMVNMAGKIAPALAVGCTVVMKPAPQDPLAVIELAEIMDEVGFPAGVVNVITSSAADVPAALTTSRNVDMISFTGSTGVGERIFEAGGRTMKRLLLELGGKGAALVLDDADIATAVTALASVWGFHSGQICTAPTRAIVHRSRYDELVAALAATAPRMKVGDPLGLDTVVGPVISGAQRDRINGYVTTGAAQGATVVVDGRDPIVDDSLRDGFYVGPTLLADCRPDMTPVQEEIFGPVIVVVPFDDDDEGVTIANGTDFGLYDYVFSQNTERAFRLAKQLRSGNVGINTAQRNPDTPFGGFKMSGVGRDGGDFGLHAYTEMQSIVWPG
ncbi:MAG TPA: aldehyde dehydrogenase family protein [Ilumatobacteraceae bacterium]|nr:aldehyde dehydrogenase family protein [Ilumatobacteraceae bacterium]